MQNQDQNFISKLFDIFIQSTGVSTDTRSLKTGQIFFAIKGDTFDGNRFVQDALKKGAVAVICEQSEVRDADKIFEVKSPLGVLQDLARHYIRQFDVPVLAITGSNGKTTNKELVARILSEKYKVHSTPGNFNNHIGLPLTILRAPENTEFFVLEMGTNHFGEIKELCKIALPEYGIILNVGKSHLEFLGSVEGVLAAKSELADFLHENQGRLFINGDEKSIEKLHLHPVSKILYDANRLSENMSLVGVRKTPYLHIDITDRITGQVTFIKTHLLGDHNLMNIENAIAISLYFGISIPQIKSGLESFEPGDNRSKTIQWNKNTVVLDAYNANPTSMWASIQAFDTSFHNPKILILGDMGELGSAAHEEHIDILDKINITKVDEVHLIGPMFQKARSHCSKPTTTYINTKEFISQAKKEIGKKNANILIKGSRFLKLEEITGTAFH